MSKYNQEEITNKFYSNCLVQAIWHKVLDWKNVKIKMLPRKYSLNPFRVTHFMWTDGKFDYDFGISRNLKLYEVIWFKGCIRKYDLGWTDKFIQNSIEFYNQKSKRKKG